MYHKYFLYWLTRHSNVLHYFSRNFQCRYLLGFMVRWISLPYLNRCDQIGWYLLIFFRRFNYYFLYIFHGFSVFEHVDIIFVAFWPQFKNLDVRLFSPVIWHSIQYNLVQLLFIDIPRVIISWKQR